MSNVAAVSMSCDWYDLPCNLSAFSTWILQILLWIPLKVMSLLLDGLATVIEAIPSLSFGTTWSSNVGTAFANAGYLADVFALQQGIIMMCTALLARFILRRIPFIG